MLRIAMINCLRANEVCTGASCLEAFWHKQGSFNIYQDEEIKLVAMMRCNGCSAGLTNQGMKEKLDRLVSLKTDFVHLGMCTKGRDGTECDNITQLAEYLSRWGIEVIRGTHL